MKRLFSLILMCLTSVLLNPLVLTADDHFAVKAPAFPAVQTVLAVESTAPETILPVSEALIPSAAAPTAAIAPSAPVVVATPVVKRVEPINYRVTIDIPSADQFVSHNLSYNDIYRFKKLVYAHNSANLLGNLKNLNVGDEFSITDGGVTVLYRVAEATLYRNETEGLNGDPTLMSQIAYSALGHDVALLTCAGTSYGNGNASHRLVVFADKI